MKYKSPNNFHKMELPIKIQYTRKGKHWHLLDKSNTIIADNLTKELAETLMQAVNYCSVAINFTKAFVECEYVVINREDAFDSDIIYRNKMRSQALAFMIELGVIDPPPKYIDAFPIWRAQLMDDFYQKVYSSRRYRYEEDEFMNLCERMSYNGYWE